MATHKCGTCFFFQEAGFAGNGWCLHADRAKSADVRTLVRRNELACRNDWGQSLWTNPKEAAETGAARKLITAQAERPATEGEIGFMVKPRDGQSDSRSRADRTDPPAGDTLAGEDVVVGQITVMPPGMTGRRRLVDQVPVELAPREPFRASMASDGSSDLEFPTESVPSRPEPSTSPVADREPATTPLGGRDRARPQRVLPRSSDRADLDPRSTPGDHPDLTRSALTDEQPLRRRNRPETGPQRRSEHHQTETRAASPDGASDRSTPPRPVMAPSDEVPAGNRDQRAIDRDFPRGVRPAPIPGPVPSRELRGDRGPERRPVMANDPGRPTGSGSGHSDEHDHAHQPSRPMPSPMPSPMLDERGTLSAGPPARSQPTRRPVLPDLSDDFFTRGVISPPATGTGSNRDSSSEERQGGWSLTQPMSDSTAVPHTAEPRPVRARPAIPRLGTEQDRQPVAAPVPTVAEANRQDWVAPTARPIQPPRVAAAPRPDTGWAAPRPAGNQPPRGNTQRPVMANDPSAADRDDLDQARLEPPIPLRPQPIDFGEYGGWFDLQSVEPRLAPNLQRACETCRDFRPSENGDRGWCANPDAFTLRTVVNATDLPCISSFGCWWVPFDDIWLSEAAIRGHRNPTPLLDQVIGAEEDLPATSRHRRRSQ